MGQSRTFLIAVGSQRNPAVGILKPLLITSSGNRTVRNGKMDNATMVIPVFNEECSTEPL